MATYTIAVNGQQRSVTVDPGTPLLWVLREELRLTGTKYGCGVAACGACTVHVGGVPTRRALLAPDAKKRRRVLDLMDEKSATWRHTVHKGHAVGIAVHE